MPHFVRILNRRNHRVFEAIKKHVEEVHDGITFDSLCLSLRQNRTSLLTSINILKRHKFISQCDRHRYHPVDRTPLLMPFRGMVR
ncbi:hypothetical protein Enr17x_48590 [Gimesia fumaroli]|uniref:Uncharacterized protein n=1 Tax=Gimesia fumaroli TaxID=2527976 RepID=A0A518II90_9PLAN|nr:hypothetical protein Enr17x_48590 [Gimesia fumaroli]